MSKAVLISIHPRWCEKIASGEKTIEIRKTRPKLQPPFKCYIYCTMDHPYISVSCGELDKLNYRTNTVGRCNGKVIGEFVCDTYVTDKTFGHDALFNAAACMNESDVVAYSAGSPIYGWHISNLKIYDTPRKLSEFKGLCKVESDCCACPHYNYSKMDCDGRTIKRPPQSWCYVENVKGCQCALQDAYRIGGIV